MQLDFESYKLKLLDPDLTITQHITNLFSQDEFNNHILNLAKILNQLDKQLHEKIGDHYHLLLAQSDVHKDVENSFEQIKKRLLCLKEISDRLVSKIIQPLDQLKDNVKELTNIQETCDLLRSCSRFENLFNKLEIQFSQSNKEVVKAAVLIKEIENVIEHNPKLSEINKVAPNLVKLENFKTDLINKSLTLLQEGINCQNQVFTSTALQVFYHLGTLKATIIELLNEKFYGNFQKNLVDCFDFKMETSAITTPNHSELTELKDSKSKIKHVAKKESQVEIKKRFWKRWESMLNDLHLDAIKIIHLQLVLLKKRESFFEKIKIHSFPADPLTSSQSTELSMLQEDNNLMMFSLIPIYVGKIEEIFRVELASRLGEPPPRAGGNEDALLTTATNPSKRLTGHHQHLVTLLRQTCEWEYLKLLKQLLETKERILYSNQLVMLEKTLEQMNYRDLNHDLPDILNDIMKPMLGANNTTGSKTSQYKDAFSDNTASPITPSYLKHTIMSLFTSPLIDHFAQGYLSKSLSRLFDPVNVLFTSSINALPSTSDLEGLIKLMANELNISTFDYSFATKIAQNVNKALRSILLKSEQLIDNTSFAYKITTKPNSAQKHNAHIASLLYHLRYMADTKIRPIYDEIRLNGRSEDIINIESDITNLQFYNDFENILENELPTLLRESLLQPFFRALEYTMEDILITMHKENFLITNTVTRRNIQVDDDATGNNSAAGVFEPLPPSPYMKEFLDFAKSFRKNVLNTLFHKELNFGLAIDDTLQDFQTKSTTTTTKEEYTFFYDVVWEIYLRQTILPTISNALHLISLIRPFDDEVGLKRIFSDTRHFQSAFTALLPMTTHPTTTTTNSAGNPEFIAPYQHAFNSLPPVHRMPQLNDDDGSSIFRQTLRGKTTCWTLFQNILEWSRQEISSKPRLPSIPTIFKDDSSSTILSPFTWFSHQHHYFSPNSWNRQTHHVTECMNQLVNHMQQHFRHDVNNGHENLRFKLIFVESYVIPLAHLSLNLFDWEVVKSDGNDESILKFIGHHDISKSSSDVLGSGSGSEITIISPHTKLNFNTVGEYWRLWLKPKVGNRNLIEMEDDNNNLTCHAHETKIVLELLKSCLDDYSTKAINQHLQTFHPAYPVCVELVNQALSYINDGTNKEGSTTTQS